jgi:hypothetical protein
MSVLLAFKQKLDLVRLTTMVDYREMVTSSRFLLIIGAGLLVCTAREPVARAQAPVAQQSAQCALVGAADMPVNLPIYDGAGQVIARFSGGESSVRASDFPSDAAGKVKIETAIGRGGFRIQGAIEVSKLPLYTSYSVPVVAGHVWIRANQSVSPLAGGPGKLKIQKTLTTPIHQTFSTWAPCSALTLTAGTPPGWNVAGHARGYVLKRESIDLYDDGLPNAALVTTLYRSPVADGVLFFSTEQRPGFVHVEYQGAVAIDAWAKASDLSPLPRGETMDQQAPPSTKRNAPKLSLSTTPRVVKPTRDVPIRGAAKDTAAVIGAIEAGTETYVMDVMAGWVSVMPQSLHVIPADGAHFWVKASELGI